MFLNVFMPRCGDEAIYNSYKAYLEERAPEHLVKIYYKQLIQGAVGHHLQGILLLALHEEFLERFGETPIIFKGLGFRFKGMVRLKNGKLHYEEFDPHKSVLDY